MRVGVDLVPVARMARLLASQPRIVTRLFTAEEQRYCGSRRHAEVHYAARFAAKEAVLKALGTGLATGMRWTDVEVRRDRNGRPRVHLHGAVAAHAGEIGVTDLDVSLSHTGEHAVAHAIVVLAEGKPTEEE